METGQRPANGHQDNARDLRAPRRPLRPARLRMQVAIAVERRRRDHDDADHRFRPAVLAQRHRHAPRVALQRAELTERRDAVHRGRREIEREDALQKRLMLMTQVRPGRENPLRIHVLHPEARRRDHELLPARDRVVLDLEERDEAVVEWRDARVRIERRAEDHVPRLVNAKSGRRAAEKQQRGCDDRGPRVLRCRRLVRGAGCLRARHTRAGDQAPDRGDMTTARSADFSTATGTSQFLRTS